MAISEKIAAYMQKGSMIRKLFEEGARLKADGSGRPVYDFSIGNPDLEPPQEFSRALARHAQDTTHGRHKYMANTGYEETRRAVAVQLEKEYNLPFHDESIIMTVGAGGGLNTLLKAVVNPGEEVLTVAPYFVEYGFYCDNHGINLRTVECDRDFHLPLEKIDHAITEKTGAVIINNPNNPTGVVYTQDELNRLGEILARHSAGRKKPLYLIDDAPYRKLVYDVPHCSSAFAAYEHTFMVTSHSKDLGLPGERIGYIAISPRTQEPALIYQACAFTNRTLGFVNAPALMQRVVAQIQDVTIDLSWYKGKRDRLYTALRHMGYELPYPGGAFYMFPAVPAGMDEQAFVDLLTAKRVLTVPGSAFGKPGYFRLSYCVDDEKIDGALPFFEDALREARQKQ
ncbi:pyridoxal phosphate-dependent aminotransferase [Chitinivibrio alkaliphilus]|uniref:Aspartate aminotransferase n=1 Tax=Chitinivibrio alkaliphilus ACht1 TaxID=1313304 RepID=U7DDU4_9BACT|nr:pyridoxal phosphate-dependent aminotransferase [Chitinivibrio alkaliphilus]ERP39071.1 aspartate aminotransferase [Chitinivibrio alkaliphilus ACht1]